MELRKQFEEETGDSPSFRMNPLIETFSHDYVEWLEAKLKQLQNTSSNSEYKSPSAQLNQLRKLLLEQEQLDPEINKLVNENFWDLI